MTSNYLNRSGKLRFLLNKMDEVVVRVDISINHVEKDRFLSRIMY